jgi:hypothetical protein
MKRWDMTTSSGMAQRYSPREGARCAKGYAPARSSLPGNVRARVSLLASRVSARIAIGMKERA